MISQVEGLSIAQLVFFSPALLLSLWLTFKHGLGRDQAWFFTILLCLCRIIGTACDVAADSSSNLSSTTYSNLVTAYYVCNGIGVSFLIQALICLVSRVNDGLVSAQQFPRRLMRLPSILLLVAIVLGAISGSNGPQATESQMDKAKAEAGASAVLFTVVGLALLGMTVFLFTRLNVLQQQGDRTIMLAVTACLPFLAVRLIYGLCVAFDGRNSTSVFYRYAPNIWVEAFMSAMEEFIIVGLILITGLVIPSIAKSSRQKSQEDAFNQQSGTRLQYGQIESNRVNNFNMA